MLQRIYEPYCIFLNTFLAILELISVFDIIFKLLVLVSCILSLLILLIDLVTYIYIPSALFIWVVLMSTNFVQFITIILTIIFLIFLVFYEEIIRKLGNSLVYIVLFLFLVILSASSIFYGQSLQLFVA